MEPRSVPLCLEPETLLRHLTGTRSSPPASGASWLRSASRACSRPVRAQRANAFAERWARTERQECLDNVLVVSRRHLEAVIREYARHYNEARPHRGLGLAQPVARPAPRAPGEVVRRDLMGGIIPRSGRHHPRVRARCLNVPAPLTGGGPFHVIEPLSVGGRPGVHRVRLPVGSVVGKWGPCLHVGRGSRGARGLFLNPIGAYDVAVLLSNDADHIPAVEWVQSRGRKVTNAT
jgi:hypothetical protein